MNKYISAIVLSVLLALPVTARPQTASPVPVPQRGFISSTPAETWEQGLISGNGNIGANVMSRPLDETIIFTHSGLFLPQGPPTMPPDQSARLFEIRRLIDQGLYKQATQLQFQLSGQESFMYPDPFVPAFDMGIKMKSEKEIHDYIRSVNFQNGESLVHWSDINGSYERRLFVSRADSLVVMKITASKKGLLNCEIRLQRTIPSDKLSYNYIQGSMEAASTYISDVKIAAEGDFLTYKNNYSKAYPGSIHSLERLAMLFVTGGTKTTNRDNMVISGADEIGSNPALIDAFKKSINYKLEKHWKGKGSGFMSFGLVQLGQAGASIGDTTIVYESLKHMVNRFWLNNLASMHNHKSLFNMDISGGMPAVIIKSLVASDPGRVKLLPALPPAWPEGEIQGVLCRGQIEITSLKWEKNLIRVSLVSGKDQSINLDSPGATRKVHLPAGKVTTIEIKK